MKVDESLIREAQLLTTGATIHTTQEAIVWYRARAQDGIEHAFQDAERNLREHLAKLRAYRYSCGGRI